MTESHSHRIASYEADPEAVARVLLLYSGGLDTSVMLHWIQERYGAEVVTLTVNLGQPGEDWDVVTGKARDLGAVETVLEDAREEFARDYVLPAIKANALYGGGYPLFTALGRPLIAKLAVEAAREHGCDTIAHGCTGKGNDQVRLEGTIATLDPGSRRDRPGPRVEDGPRGGDRLRTRARHPGQGRHRVRARTRSTTTSGAAPRRAGRSRTSNSPRPRTSSSSSPAPERAQEEPELLRVGFEAGCPVSLDGERLGLVELIERAAEAGCRHGVGIVDHLEDRIVGLKVRDIYEVPAAEIILTAHRELEKLVSTIHQNNFKGALESHWAYLTYAGLWLEPLRLDLDAFMDSLNRNVTGEVTVKLYRGSATAVARSSPYALYDRSLASFGESGGEFSQQASPGFIELFTLQSRLAHRVRRRADEDASE